MPQMYNSFPWSSIDYHVENRRGVLVRTFSERDMAMSFAKSRGDEYGGLHVVEVTLVRAPWGRGVQWPSRRACAQ
jgi:hypothetical protein